MKRYAPAIIVAVIFTLLFVISEQKHRIQSEKDQAQIKQIEAELATLQEALRQKPAVGEPEVDEGLSAPEPEPPAALPAVAAEKTQTQKVSDGRRMMGNMAKMMENPTMNKVMQASQRGAVGALYADMLEYLDLNTEETTYFMDLLMYRQMKNVDVAMKMMAGNLGEEEKKALQAEMKEASETVKSEMEKFLNNPDDFAEWEFYEKTMGERMMLSQMDQNLSGTDAALSDEAYRGLLGMMNEEKSNYNFSSDLNDEKNTDLSPQRFSKQNIQNHINDVKKLNELISARAEGMLTPAQFEEFEKSLKATSDMQISQLEMAGQMLGGGE